MWVDDMIAGGGLFGDKMGHMCLKSKSSHEHSSCTYIWIVHIKVSVVHIHSEYEFNSFACFYASDLYHIAKHWTIF